MLSSGAAPSRPPTGFSERVAFCDTAEKQIDCSLARRRAHPLDLMEAQALSLGLPLLHIVIPKDADYKESYVSGMKKLKAGFTPPP